MKAAPLAISCVVLFAMSSAVTSAAPMTGVLNWQGNEGYSAVIRFDYDSAFPVVSAGYAGQYEIVGLSNIRASVYSPDEIPLIENAWVIQNGSSGYQDIRFYFDTITRDFVPGSLFNVGTVPQAWLAGSPSDWTLYSASSGNGISSGVPLDQGGKYYVEVISRVDSAVPEAGQTGAMLLGSLSLIGLAGRYLRRA